MIASGRFALACCGFLVALSGCVIERSVGRHAGDTGTDSAGETNATSDTGTGIDTETGAHECVPEPNASACAICEAEMCCIESTACREHDVCSCMVSCLIDGHSFAACETNCGSDAGLHEDLLHCLAQSCPGACGL